VSEVQNKPVAIETRRDLLFTATRRRSVKSIFVWCFVAFSAGLLASFAVRGLVDIHKGDRTEDRISSALIDLAREGDVIV